MMTSLFGVKREKRKAKFVKQNICTLLFLALLVSAALLFL